MPASAINKRDNNGWTAAHVGAIQGCSDCLRLLERGGADLSIPDAANRTALHLFASILASPSNRMRDEPDFAAAVAERYKVGSKLRACYSRWLACSSRWLDCYSRWLACSPVSPSATSSGTATAPTTVVHKDPCYEFLK